MTSPYMVTQYGIRVYMSKFAYYTWVIKKDIDNIIMNMMNVPAQMNRRITLILMSTSMPADEISFRY